jgi:hypothetical protein
MKALISCGRTLLVTAPPLIFGGCGGNNSRSSLADGGGTANSAVGPDGSSSAADFGSQGSPGGQRSMDAARASDAGDASAARDSTASDQETTNGNGGGDATSDRYASDGALADGPGPSDGGTGHAIKTVFLILMENHDWAAIKGSASAPYINSTLLPSAAHAKQYFNPPGIHPSLPNYLWLEAGQNFGILNDNDPSTNHQATTMHLVTQMKNAGLSWRAYEEDIPGTNCPLTGTGNYAVRHDPFVYFDDVTMGPSASCIENVRPYTQLATDLAADSVAQYNFITPNVCDDMHDDQSNNSTCASPDSIKDGDTWLSTEVPKIQASSAYKNGGAIFITWDEGEGDDGPIGMIVLSPLGRGGGYSNTVSYTHSSTLRTMQVIFNLSPFLADADNATDLHDLFSTFP